jgi:hypothetical protein
VNRVGWPKAWAGITARQKVAANLSSECMSPMVQLFGMGFEPSESV